MSEDADIDSALAYYLFINHGILPHVVLEMDNREKAFVLAMARREVKSRPKQ